MIRSCSSNRRCMTCICSCNFRVFCRSSSSSLFGRTFGNSTLVDLICTGGVGRRHGGKLGEDTTFMVAICAAKEWDEEMTVWKISMTLQIPFVKIPMYTLRIILVTLTPADPKPISRWFALDFLRFVTGNCRTSTPNTLFAILVRESTRFGPSRRTNLPKERCFPNLPFLKGVTRSLMEFL